LELPDSISFAGYDQMRCSFALKVDPNHRKRYGELPKLIPCDIFEKRQQQRSAWKDIIQARARHALWIQVFSSVWSCQFSQDQRFANGGCVENAHSEGSANGSTRTQSDWCGMKPMDEGVGWTGTQILKKNCWSKALTKSFVDGRTDRYLIHSYLCIYSPQYMYLYTVRSPCERHAGVSSFGLGYSEMFEWIKGSSQDCSRHVLHRNSTCVSCAGPKRTWIIVWQRQRMAVVLEMSA